MCDDAVGALPEGVLADGEDHSAIADAILEIGHRVRDVGAGCPGGWMGERMEWDPPAGLDGDRVQRAQGHAAPGESSTHPFPPKEEAGPVTSVAESGIVDATDERHAASATSVRCVAGACNRVGGGCDHDIRPGLLDLGFDRVPLELAATLRDGTESAGQRAEGPADVEAIREGLLHHLGDPGRLVRTAGGQGEGDAPAGESKAFRDPGGEAGVVTGPLGFHDEDSLDRMVQGDAPRRPVSWPPPG